MARVRTDEKRKEIVQTAAELFEKLGYDRCSMAALSERLGGSKATLYGYFPSKEDLLRAVLDFQVATDADRIMRDFPASGNLRESLILLGTAYLNKRMSSLPITNIRMVATQPAGSTMGKDFYESIIRPAFHRLSDKFEALIEEGKLIPADPEVMMLHWKGLCDWDFFEQRLLGAIDGPDPKQIKKAVTLAADAFLKLYGAAIEEPASKKK
ncbi:MAG TPA: TetR/AcrR family transcriptional regulator [Sphingomicrobium sp.]|nr:TetR/AcrR family transcriptional regulator [Sphingomicrobium sp.]